MTVATPTQDLPATAATEQPSSLLTWAYLDYCRQQREGVAPNPAEYCARFPSIQQKLAQLLSVHRLVNGDIHFTDPPKVRWPEPEEEFAGFRLERELGRGRFSHVFLAAEPALGHRRVVVKVTQSGMDEALTLGRLVHPNIVPIFSVRKDEATGLGVVCMPYLGEATLGDLLARVLGDRPLPRDAAAILDAAGKGQPAEPPTTTDAASVAIPPGASYLDGIRRLAIQLLDALAFIHAEGVCHRDLKPSNVLLTRAGVPMLLDFNLSGDVRHVRMGLGGTPTYMAPEQLQRLGRRDGTGLDGRADLFSFGVMLYELLTGRHPFAHPPTGIDLEQIRHWLLAQYTAGAAAVRSLNPAVDGVLAELVDRCLAFAPADRPASAREARALIEAAPLRTRQRRWPFVTRRGLVLALVLPLLLSGATLRPVATVPPVTPAPTVSEYALSQEAYHRGDYAEARRYLDEYLRAHPDDARGWFQHGVVLLKLKEYQLAVMDFSTADRLQPDGLTKACLGYGLKQNNQPKTARYYFEQAVKAGYATAPVLNDLAYLHLMEGALAEAESDLTRAIDLAPRLQAAYHNRGKVYLARSMARPAVRPGAPIMKAGDRLDVASLQLALRDLKVALTMGPPSAELHQDAALACVYLSGRDAAFATVALDHLANAVHLGLDPDVLAQRPFPRYLGAFPAYQSLRTPPRGPQQQTIAHRFLAMPPE